MKKSFNFLICALLICTVVWSLWGCADNLSYEQEPATNNVREQLKTNLSHEVTQAEARENLEKLLLEMKISSTRGGDAMQIPPITSVYTRGKAALATRAGEEVEPYFHIFNFGDNEGFAIMSGDDRVEPLLALTFKGELTPETEIDNPGFEIAYEKMEEYYIARIGADTIPSIGFDDPILPPTDSIEWPEIPDDQIPVRYEVTDSLAYYEMVCGYCPTSWHQDSPYNDFCETKRGERAKAGCVAISVGQLMATYMYPPSYNGQNFNWIEMQNSAPNISGRYQVAKLIQLLGLRENLKMDYGVDGSDADPERIPGTLSNFGYANGGTLIDYNSGIVIGELRNGYPVLIGGYSSEGGHRWLAHGLMELHHRRKGYNASDEIVFNHTYLGGYYLLFNWGFDGFHDGFYLSGVFDANIPPAYSTPTRSTQDLNFSSDMTAVVNIRKN